MKRREPDDRSAVLRHDDPVAGDAHALEAPGHGIGVDRISQLAEEIGDRRGILVTCVPDCRLHEV
jgi:hypothetical protein